MSTSSAQYVVINAITVPAAQADELAKRFAGRAGMVDSADGFVDFELLRPADGREQWLVKTTWRDQAAFEAWRASTSFGQAHADDRPAGGHPGGGHPGGHPAGAPGAHGAGQPPVSTMSEIWAFTVEQQSSKA